MPVDADTLQRNADRDGKGMERLPIRKGLREKSVVNFSVPMRIGPTPGDHRNQHRDVFMSRRFVVSPSWSSCEGRAIDTHVPFSRPGISHPPNCLDGGKYAFGRTSQAEFIEVRTVIPLQVVPGVRGQAREQRLQRILRAAALAFEPMDHIGEGALGSPKAGAPLFGQLSTR